MREKPFAMARRRPARRQEPHPVEGRNTAKPMPIPASLARPVALMNQPERSRSAAPINSSTTDSAAPLAMTQGAAPEGAWFSEPAS